jgi:UDP-N-acetylmuramyl tripeptide synthase
MMKNHGIAERVSDMGDRARERLVHSRMEKLDRDNERLRTEVSLLRGDLDAERISLKDALKGLDARNVTVKESRKPRLIRALVIAGSAYVLGARAGHERYDQIVRKSRSLSDGVKHRMKQRDGDGWESSSGTESDVITPPGSGSS